VATVAVLGTGIMGGPIARRLAEAGHVVRAWNRTSQKATLPGVTVAPTPAEAAAGAEAVVTMLADGAAVEAVMTAGGALEALPAGALWIQMSTIGAAETDRLALRAAERQVVFVDAPVLGSKAQAESGDLTLLASGPEEARERCAELARPVMRELLWLGPAGVGTRLKLVCNNWILCTIENLAETLALAQALGVDAQAFFSVLDGRAFDMAYAHLKGGMMLSGDFPAAFPLRLARKDLALVLQEAASSVELPLVEAALARYERAVELGHGDEDVSAVYRIVG
jgi:3-hydroxyisobutyrate dehydrogenase